MDTYGCLDGVFQGTGTVVVKTRGIPVVLPVTPTTFADCNAVVAWSAASRLPRPVRRSPPVRAVSGDGSSSVSGRARRAAGVSPAAR